MRPTFRILGLAALLLLTGCYNWAFLRKDQPLPGGDKIGDPTTANLVNYFNVNATRVQSMFCSDVEFDCTVGLQSFSLSGKMACEQPRGFRMTANSPVVGKGELD